MVKNYALNNPKKSDIIVSLTTIPSRQDKLYNTIKSLFLQDILPQKIVLNVPDYSIREKKGYNIPSDITSLVEIRYVGKDWGCATKFIPTILSENKEQKILIIDDDVVIPSNYISDYMYYSEKYPNSAIGTRGWDIPVSLKWRDSKTIWGYRNVDVLTGVGTILIKPRFFDERITDYNNAPKEAFFVDDIWLSGNLARNNIERVLVPIKPRVKIGTLLPSNSLIFNENRDGNNNDVMLKFFWG